MLYLPLVTSLCKTTLQILYQKRAMRISSERKLFIAVVVILLLSTDTARVAVCFIISG